jgi:ketosteroid isomerase-like protein
VVLIGLILCLGCIEKTEVPDTSTPIVTKTDEMIISELILEKAECSNNWDWECMYKLYSPNYRNAYPYDEFEKDRKDAWITLRMFGAHGNLSVENIKVKVDGNIGYATYVLRIGTDIWDSRTEGDEDLWRKLNGQWYDIEEDPEDKGWNEEDALNQ